MKKVLISINPKWCEKIVSGEKTIEVRKSSPKKVPFKCYIYCTKEKWRDTMYRGSVVSGHINDSIKWSNAFYRYLRYAFDVDKIENTHPYGRDCEGTILRDYDFADEKSGGKAFRIVDIEATNDNVYNDYIIKEIKL